MKKVLFVTYRFPPQGGGGVQRTLKFTTDRGGRTAGIARAASSS